MAASCPLRRINATTGLTEAYLTEFHDPLTGVSYGGKRVPYSRYGLGTYSVHWPFFRY